MSYCRWSSDHFECDVYVYEDVSGGWTTHVADRRRKNKLPDAIKAMFPNPRSCASSGKDFAAQWMAAEQAEREWIQSQPHDVVMGKNTKGEPVPMYFLADSEYFSLSDIGEEAGASYNDPSPGESANRLEALRAKGFNVPQYAIDALREEQAEFSQTVKAPHE